MDSYNSSFLPKRLFTREITSRGRERCFGGPPSFLDITTNVASTLEWAPGQSQCLSPGSELIPIYSVARIPSSPALLVGDENGDLHILPNWWDPLLPNLDQAPTSVITTHISDSSAVGSVKAGPGGRQAFVGTGSGHFVVVDLESGAFLHNFEAHYKSIKKVDSFIGDVVATCGKDNNICVFDLRVKSSKNPVNKVQNAHAADSFGVRTTPRGRKKGSAATAPNEASASVTDFIFLDETHIISAGSSDGRLKEWDLRLSYKQLSTCHPLQVVEYPSQSNVRGYSCLQLAGNKLFASSVTHEIFQINVGTMTCEAIYMSPTHFSNYTKIDVSTTGDFLACGSDAPEAHVFCTEHRKIQDPFNIDPIRSLDHDPIYSNPVCCPIFSPFDDFMVTTGGDSSILAKWAPTTYLQSSFELEKESRKRDLESGPAPPPITSEFKYLSPPRASKTSPRKIQPHPFLRSPCKNSYTFNNKENSDARAKSSLPRDRVCFAKLDSFPNYVVDGMILPHVCPPRIKIKLRPKDETPFVWALSPDVKAMAIRVQSAKDTTPTRAKPSSSRKPLSSASRKRRKFCDEENSPKISHYFPRMSPSAATGINTTPPGIRLERECDSLNSRGFDKVGDGGK